MAKNYEIINSCIICQSTDLSVLFHVGNTCLTGYFPIIEEVDPIATPITLNACNSCGNLQMREKVNPELMFREYWYRSSTTKSMQAHLQKIADNFAIKGANHLDIGCNDGLLMTSMTERGMNSWGIDPSSAAMEAKPKFPGRISNDFFSKSAVTECFQDSDMKFDLITAISMFYDVPNPVNFLQDVYSMLADGGKAIIEVNYAKSFLERQNIDMLGQEHLVYYFIQTFQSVSTPAGLHITDAYKTDMNGGNITFILQKAPLKTTSRLKKLIEEEQQYLTIFDPKNFQNTVSKSFQVFANELRKLSVSNEVKIMGASTRGAFIAQYLNLNSEVITSAVDLQKNKMGRRIPGTDIKIEYDPDAKKPDIYLVMPYQFKTEIIDRYTDFLLAGGRMLFYRPIMCLVSADENGAIIENVIQ